MQLLNQVNECIKSLQTNLTQSGFAILQSRVTLDVCQHITDFIDKYPQKNAEINYCGTEKRIWDAQVFDPVIQAFSSFSDRVVSKILNRNCNVKTVLASSNFPIPMEKGLTMGRWHIDSFRNQFKLFCFLTRTEAQTGPLEIIPSTHRAAFKLRALASGQYISCSNVTKEMRRYQRLDEQWTEAQMSKLGGSVPLLCDPGTLVLVNTSAIHRARPCLEGYRYSLTSYYAHF